MYVLGVRRDSQTFEVEEVVDGRPRAPDRDWLEVVWRPAAIARVPRRGDVLSVSAGGRSKPDLAIPPPPDAPYEVP